jgi:hypothetical protein
MVCSDSREGLGLVRSVPTVRRTSLAHALQRAAVKSVPSVRRTLLLFVRCSDYLIVRHLVVLFTSYVIYVWLSPVRDPESRMRVGCVLHSPPDKGALRTHDVGNNKIIIIF